MRQNSDPTASLFSPRGFRDYYLLLPLLLCGLLIASYWFTDTTIVAPTAEDLAEWQPYRRMAAESWSSGHFPLWSAQMLCGLPLAGWPHANAFYPPGLVLGLFNYSHSSVISLFVHVLIFQLGLTFMLRGLGIRLEAAVISSLIVSFGPLLSYLQQNTPPNDFTMAWSPWLFGFAFHLLRSRRLLFLLGLAASFALQVMGGRYDFILRELIVMGLLAGCLAAVRPSRLGAIGLWLAGGIAGVLLAAPAFLMHYEYFGQSLRQLPLGYEYYSRFQKDVVPSALFMAWVLAPSSALALAGLFFKARKELLFGSLVILALSLLWAASPDFWVRINHALPFLGQTRWPQVAYSLGLLALAVLLGEGIAGWIDRAPGPRLFNAALWVMAGFGLAFLIASGLSEGPNEGLSEVGLYASSFFRGKRAAALALLSLAATAAVMKFLRPKAFSALAESRRARTGLWFALVLADVAAMALFGTIRMKEWSPRDNPLFPPRTQREFAAFRHLNLFPWSRWLDVSVPIQSGSEPGGRSIDGFISMPLLRYGEFLSLISERTLEIKNGRVTDERFMSAFKEGDFLSPRALALLEFANVRYYVVEDSNLKFAPVYLFGWGTAAAKDAGPGWARTPQGAVWEQTRASLWTDLIEPPPGARFQAQVSGDGLWMASLAGVASSGRPRLIYCRAIDGAGPDSDGLDIEVPLADKAPGRMELKAAATPLGKDRGWFRWSSPLLTMPDRPLSLVLLQGDQAVFEDRRALAQATIVHQVKVIPDHDARLDYLRSNPERLREEVVLERSPAVSPAPLIGNSEAVEMSDFADQSLTFRARLQRPGLVVMSEVWYPGWRAREGGQELELLRANHAFRAVALPTGLHAVRLTYEPVSFRIGLWCSLAALGAIIVSLARRKSARG